MLWEGSGAPLLIPGWISYIVVGGGGSPGEGRVGGRTPLPVDLSYLSFVGCFDTPLLDAWPRGPGLADLGVGGFREQSQEYY